MITIIIPVYNGANVIHRAIDNVIKQTYRDWELIVVNDGSNDATEEKLSEYAVCDKIRIITKNNGGVSSARNMGINAAQGEYITFMDADDIIEETYLEQLCKGIGFDFIITGFCYNEAPQVPSIRINQVKTKEKIAENISEYLQTDNFCFPWARMFRLSIIKKNNIRFDEKLRFGEDHVFNWTYLCYINSILIDNSTLYHKMSEDNSGVGYSNLTFDEIDYLDSSLFNLKCQMEHYYNTIITPALTNLFHIPFMKDCITYKKLSFYVDYYKKYHPEATEKEAYDHIAKYLFHPAICKIKKGTLTLKELNDFIDTPQKLFFNTKIKSKIIIPLLKMHLYKVVKLIISKI